MVNFVDLFSGIGGIRLGVSEALTKNGIDSKCVLSSEINKQACETYQLNFGEYPSGDIRTIHEIKPFDLLLAGFPCQPFSYAGKRKGFGETRGTLFFEIERILHSYHPRAFLLENVRGLYNHDHGRTFNTILTTLQRLGYGTLDILLNSSDFGVPQNRVRLYLLGILGEQPQLTMRSCLGASDSHKYKKYSMQRNLFEVTSQSSCVKDILEQNVDKKYDCSQEFTEQLHNAIGEDLEKLHGYRLIDYRGGQSLHSWELGIKGKCSQAEREFMNLLIKNRRKHKFGTEQDGKKLTLEQIKTFYKQDDILEIIESLLQKKYLALEEGKYNPVCGNMSFEVFKFLDPDSIAITLTSSDANRLGIIQNRRARRITPRECARLQGFPDSFQLHHNDACSYKHLGNSVSVPVISAIFDDFIKQNIAKLQWR